MSADNGVYILRSPAADNEFDYRVVHASAIDNITYEPDKKGFNTEQVMAYFGGAKVFHDNPAAMAEASYIADTVMADGFCPILEYGIQTIHLPFPFPDSNKKCCDAGHGCTGCESTIETPSQSTNLLLEKIAKQIENVALETKISRTEANDRDEMRQRTISMGVLTIAVSVVLCAIIWSIMW